MSQALSSTSLEVQFPDFGGSNNSMAEVNWTRNRADSTQSDLSSLSVGSDESRRTSLGSIFSSEGSSSGTRILSSSGDLRSGAKRRGSKHLLRKAAKAAATAAVEEATEVTESGRVKKRERKTVRINIEEWRQPSRNSPTASSPYSHPNGILPGLSTSSMSLNLSQAGKSQSMDFPGREASALQEVADRLLETEDSASPTPSRESSSTTRGWLRGKRIKALMQDAEKTTSLLFSMKSLPEPNGSNAGVTLASRPPTLKQAPGMPSRSPTHVSFAGGDRKKSTIGSLLQGVFSRLYRPIDPKSTMWRTITFLIFMGFLVQLGITPINLAWSYTTASPTSIGVGHLLFDLAVLSYRLAETMVQVEDDCGIPYKDMRELRKIHLMKRGGTFKLLLALPWQLLVWAVPVKQDLFKIYHVGMSPSESFSQIRLFLLVLLVKCLVRTPYSTIFRFQLPFVDQATCRMIKSLIILLFVAHLDTCFFWLVETSIDSHHRYIDERHLIYSTKKQLVAMTTQYLDGLLISLCGMFLRVRYVHSNLDIENTYAILEMFVGVLTSGTVVGIIHSSVALLDRYQLKNEAAEEHKHRSVLISEQMKNLGLGRHVQDMVKDYQEIQFRKAAGAGGADESFLFDDLPRDLLQRVKNHLYLDLVRKVPLFGDMEAGFLNAVTLKMKSLDLLDGWYVFRKDDQGDEMYIIRSGEVEIVQGKKILVTLKSGACFGEIALYKACRRTASARAKGFVELCLLKKEDFAAILNGHPEFARRIAEIVETREKGSAPAPAPPVTMMQKKGD
ncbi:hypothetical protein HDU96_007037 [Phlyctochytrium bullatum]|nr:hypothetical protein HDU96_007037 [Phlyctochytrium bullatum]